MTLAHSFGRAHQTSPALRFGVFAPYQEDFNFSASSLMAEQAGRNNPRIVQNQQITGFKVITDIFEQALSYRSGSAIQHHHAGSVPFRCRIASNQLFWKIIIKFFYEHATIVSTDFKDLFQALSQDNNRKGFQYSQSHSRRVALRPTDRVPLRGRNRSH